MFDISKFNEELSDIWSTIVGDIMSFVPNRDVIEKAFYIGEILENSQRCTFFYQAESQIQDPLDIAKKMGLTEKISKDNAFAILDYCNKELTRIKELFEKTNQEFPKSIKIIYDAHKESLDAKFSYERITAKEYGLYDAVCDWQEELKAALSTDQG